MTENKPNKKKSLEQQLLKLFILSFLPTFVGSFVRYGGMLMFVVFSLKGRILSDETYIWGVFLLAIFGLWKLFDLLDVMIGGFVSRFKKENE